MREKRSRAVCRLQACSRCSSSGGRPARARLRAACGVAGGGGGGRCQRGAYCRRAAGSSPSCRFWDRASNSCCLLQVATLATLLECLIRRAEVRKRHCYVHSQSVTKQRCNARPVLWPLHGACAACSAWRPLRWLSGNACSPLHHICCFIRQPEIIKLEARTSCGGAQLRHAGTLASELAFSPPTVGTTCAGRRQGASPARAGHACSPAVPAYSAPAVH